MEAQFSIVSVASFGPGSGNVAALAYVDELDLGPGVNDGLLQTIAAEFAQPITSFLNAQGDGRFRVRWFSPSAEIGLCGHGLLGGAWDIRSSGRSEGSAFAFEAPGGTYAAGADDAGAFTEIRPNLGAPCDAGASAKVAAALGALPRECLRARDFVAVYDSEEMVRSLKPDFEQLAALDAFGVAATAKGDHDDYVLRFFVPKQGIPEDQVTGSAQATLGPYWAERLGKSQLIVRQLSKRGGKLGVHVSPETITVSGTVRRFASGTLVVPI